MMHLTPTFQKSLARLTNQEQGLVKQTVMDFLLAPEVAGLRLHPLNMRERRFHSISPNMDLRVIVLKDGGRHVMMYVDHHDAAYRWAERRKVEAHPVTGAAQLVEFEEVLREEIVVVPRDRPRPPALVGVDDDALLAAGVPATYLPYLRDVDEDGLLDLLPRLPEEAQDAVMALAAGGTPAPPPIAPAPSDGSAAIDPFAHPDAQRRFWVATDETALARALERPWEEWLVFLHPSQRAAVDRAHGGPARVTGAAGTGKSVVAMHRAARLARLSRGGRVLLCTFSPILSGRLADGMDRLLGPDSEARARVFTSPLHLYASRIVEDATGRPVRLAEPADVAPLIDAAAAETGSDWSAAFLRAEWAGVVDFRGVRDWPAYRSVHRTGRGEALSPRARRAVWDVMERVLAAMADAGLATRGDVCDAARAHLASAGGARPFRHVVVDEAQDLGPRELRFVAALAPAGPDALFFAGDAGQRIHRQPFSWIGCGVDVRGRSTRLRVNYRTSAQIHRFADRLLPDAPRDGDGEPEERGALSLFSGPEPDLRVLEDGDAERAAIVAWLSGLAARGVEPHEIAMLARTPDILSARAEPALAAAGLAWGPLSDDSEPPRDQVALGTLHAGKGLEFRAVAVIGVEADHFPPAASAPQNEEHDGDVPEAVQERERHLLYVGCSRARDTLLLTAVGACTPLLPVG